VKKVTDNFKMQTMYFCEEIWGKLNYRQFCPEVCTFPAGIGEAAAGLHLYLLG
jgi:hypothetical protein